MKEAEEDVKSKTWAGAKNQDRTGWVYFGLDDFSQRIPFCILPQLRRSFFCIILKCSHDWSSGEIQGNTIPHITHQNHSETLHVVRRKNWFLIRQSRFALDPKSNKHYGYGNIISFHTSVGLSLFQKKRRKCLVLRHEFVFFCEKFFARALLIWGVELCKTRKTLDGPTQVLCEMKPTIIFFWAHVWEMKKKKRRCGFSTRPPFPRK